MIKRTPQEWSKIDGIVVADPDGWRFPHGFAGRRYEAQDWEVPVDREEWDHRISVSSIIGRVQTPGGTLQKWADPAMFTSEPLDATTGPKVYLLHMNPDPLGSIAAAALMYKGIVVRDLADITDEQRREMFDQIQHTKLKAPFEFVNMHWMVEGVTRSLTHQMVRQRTAVFAQESLRFAVVEDGFGKRVALPPSLAGTEGDHEYTGGQEYDRLSDAEKQRVVWDSALQDLDAAYTTLVNHGMPAEDARGLLPHNVTTRLNYATNLRNFQDHAGNRLCTQAQFEWRALWIRFVEEIRNYGASRWYYRPGPVMGGVRTRESFSSAWQFDLIADMFRPVCYLTGKCEFAAQDLDRTCSIRNRVDANADLSRPSSEWDQEMDHVEGNPIVSGVGPQSVVRNQAHRPIFIGAIHPREWLADPGAAR